SHPRTPYPTLLPLHAALPIFPEPDDLGAREPFERARRCDGPPHPAGKVALELLLLPGAASPAGLPIVVLPARTGRPRGGSRKNRSEEHTSELQSRGQIVFRLL